MKVRDLMTRNVVTATPTMSLREVAVLLSERGISGVPVVDDHEAVVGVVSEADFLAKERGATERRPSLLAALFGARQDPDAQRRHEATTAGEAMTSPAITIEEERSVRDAAAIMLDRGVNRLPVTRNGALVGILTRADLVHGYLTRDAEATAAIREDVLRRTMWLDPDDMVVEVHEGVATIAGSVDRRSTAEIIERLINLVEGVDRVVSRLAWEMDDSELPPATEAEHEPGAASITARDHPRPMHW